MKKILIVANVDKEHILKFHIPTIKMLKENGWIVDVACAGNEKIPFCDKKWIMPYKRNPFSIKTFDGIKTLKKIVEQENYSIIHCHTPTGGLVTRLACTNARKNGTVVIYTAHGFHFYKGAPIINWLLFFPVEKFLSKKTDCIITINLEDYKNAKKYHFKSKKIIKIRGNGVDLNKFQKLELSSRIKCRDEFNIPYDANVLIYVAEIIKNKNQLMLLKTLKELQRKYPNSYLILVGPDHTNGKFEKLINKKGFKNVILTGWRDDITFLLNCADIYVASSIREGLGINLIEAMSLELPVIATSNRGHSSIISNNKNGYLVSINDYKEMSKKCITLIENSEKKKEMISLAKKELYKYSTEYYLKNLKYIYEGFISI